MWWRNYDRRKKEVDCVWNVMAHAQKPDFVFRPNGRVHLNRRGRQFSRLLAAEVCASAVVMLDTRCSEVVWRVLATHSIRQFPLHFPSRASPCAITFQLDSNWRPARCGASHSGHSTPFDLLKHASNLTYRGADKSLARPTSRCILFDGENISFDASLVIYINSINITPIMFINRIFV